MDNKRKILVTPLTLLSIFTTGCFYHSYSFDDISYKKVSFQKFINAYTEAERSNGRSSSALPQTATAHIEINPYIITIKTDEDGGTKDVEGKLALDCEYEFIRHQTSYYYNPTYKKIVVDDIDYTETCISSYYFPAFYGEPRFVDLDDLIIKSKTETKSFLWLDNQLYYHPSNEKVTKDGDDYYVESYRSSGSMIKARKVFVKPDYDSATFYIGTNYMKMNRHYKIVSKSSGEGWTSDDINIINEYGIRKEWHSKDNDEGVITYKDVTINWNY